MGKKRDIDLFGKSIQAYTQRAILKKQMGDKDGSLEDFQLGMYIYI